MGATALAAAGLAATSAGAAVIPPNTVLNTPPANGVSILAFSVRDFVSTAGFQETDRVTIDVIRNGVAVGSVTDLVPQDDPLTAAFDGIVEVNHPGGGCWEVNTPDILPGDEIRTTVTQSPDLARIGTADQTFVQDITAGPTTSVGGAIVVHGSAKDALTSDKRYPAGELESRLVGGRDLFASNGRRTLRAILGAGGNDGTLNYDQPFNGNVNDPANYTWTATYTGLSSADINRALAAESRAMWLGRFPAALTENTIYENGQGGGPAPPCTAPGAKTAITATSRSAINAAYIGAGAGAAPVVVSGLAEDGPAGVTGVTVDVPGGAPHAATFTPASPSATAGAPSRTWTVSIPAAEFAGLPDGSFAATAHFTGGPGVPATDSTTLVKDTGIPAAPGISPGGGFFKTAQSVRLSAEAGATIRFTQGAVGTAPGLGSAIYTDAFPMTTSGTVEAIAIDAAGNISPASSSTIAIDGVAPTSQITATTATASGVVSLPVSTSSTNATFSFGADEPASKLECQLDGGNWAPCASPVTLSGLGEGQHAFRVRATDLAGNLEVSPPTRAWTVTPPGASLRPILGPAAVGTSASAPATAALKLLTTPKSVRLSVARRGVRIAMNLPSGTTGLKYVLKRGSRTVQRRTVSRSAGVSVLKLKVTRRGAYKLTLTPVGKTSGRSRTITFKVV